MLRKIGVFVLALLLFSGCANAAGYDGRAEDEELKDYIRELCETYEIPETLVFAVIEKESSWNADAVNYNETCFGLMQISVVNFAWLEEELGLDDPKDPYQNVQAGIYMLSGYLEKYIDYHMALMCYNCGENGARQLWQEGIFTNTYSRWVIDRMNDLEWEALDTARDALAARYQEALESDLTYTGIPDMEEQEDSAANNPVLVSPEGLQANAALDGERVFDFGEPFPDAATSLTGPLSDGDDPAAHVFYAEDAVSKNVGYAGAPSQAVPIAAQRLTQRGVAAWCETFLRRIFCEQTAWRLAALACGRPVHP